MSGVLSTLRIEHLPNEIFLKIFSYLTHFNLCRAWAGLNFRIDSVLRSARSRLDLVSNYELKDYAEFLQKWAEIIVSVEDHRVSWAPWSEIDIPNKLIDIRPFINLQRFFQISDGASISHITVQNFPNLKCLHFGDYPSYDYDRILFDDPFPFLTSVSGVFLDETLSNGTSVNPIIRRVVVGFEYDANSFPILIGFIKRLPNLTTLRFMTRSFKKASLPSRIITKIRNMSIWLEAEITLDEIEVLLQISPVKRLYLEIGSEGTYGYPACNLVQLAQIINNCETLKHVELRVWDHYKKFDVEKTRQLSPWFTTLDLEYGYEKRKSLQTHHYKFERKHRRF